MRNAFVMFLGVSVLILISGCSTPKVMLKNPKTGQIESCGGSATGSLVGGVIGYQMQKSNDLKCEADLLSLGFKRIDSTDGTIDSASRVPVQEPAKTKNFGNSQ